MSIFQNDNTEISTSLGSFLRIVTGNKDLKLRFFRSSGILKFLNKPIQILKYLSTRKRKMFLCGHSLVSHVGQLDFLNGDFRTLFYYAINRNPFFVIIINKDYNSIILNIIKVLEVDDAKVTFLLRPNDQFLFFAKKNKKPIVGRFCVCPQGITKLSHHYQILQKIKKSQVPDEIKKLIPSALLYKAKDGYAMMQQKASDGHVPDLSLKCEDSIFSLLVIAIKPLIILHKNAKMGMNNDDHCLLCDKIISLKSKLQRYFSYLEFPIKIATEWFSTETQTSVLVHGDYWTGNILFTQNENKIVGIVDWDRSRVAGFPLCDALHLYIATVSIWKNQYFSTTIISFLKGEEQFVINYIEEIKEKFKCNNQDIFYTVVFLWLFYIWTSVEDGDVGDRWYDQMVPRVSRQITITYPGVDEL